MPNRRQYHCDPVTICGGREDTVEDLVRSLAYLFYQPPGNADGHDLEDWLREGAIRPCDPVAKLTVAPNGCGLNTVNL